MSRPGRAAGAQGDRPRLRDDHQGEREQLPASSGSDYTGGDPPCPRQTAELRVGMVGYAFMGAAHSQAWRTVNRVFDLPARARMALSAAATQRRWPTPPTGSAGTRTPPTGATLIARDDIDVDRRLHPGRQPRRDRHRRAGRRQARAVREAAGQHGRRGTGDGRRGGTRPGRRGAVDVRVQLPPGPRGHADAPAGRRRPARGDPARPGGRTCRTGSSTRSSRWSGGCRRTRRAPARSATSVRTSST